MKNNGKEEIRPNVWLFLPEGFTSPEPNRSCRLTPGETKVEEIPLHLEPDGKNLSPYHLIVWYDKDNAHYSRHLKGIIKVEERPAYFKGYLIFGAAILLILFAAICIHRLRRFPQITRSPIPRNSQPRIPQFLILNLQSIKSVLIILLFCLGHLFQIVLIPNALAEPHISFVLGVAPIIVVKIDMPLVPFHQILNESGIVDPGIGLDGVLVPQKEHGGVLRQDNGALRDFPDEFLGILVVIS